MKIAWYSACLLLLFLFRTNHKKGHFDKNDFCYCYGNFFSKVAFWKVTWSQLCSKFLLNKYEALWQQHFERYPTVFILRTWNNMRAKSFIKTLVSVTETRIDEGAWKMIVAQSEHLEEHCTKTETTFHLFYALLFLTN